MIATGPSGQFNRMGGQIPGMADRYNARPNTPMSPMGGMNPMMNRPPMNPNPMGGMNPMGINTGPTNAPILSNPTAIQNPSGGFGTLRNGGIGGGLPNALTGPANTNNYAPGPSSGGLFNRYNGIRAPSGPGDSRFRY